MSAKLWKMSKICAVLLCIVIALVGIPSIPLYIFGVGEEGEISSTTPAAILFDAAVSDVRVQHFIDATNLDTDGTVIHTIDITNTGNIALTDLVVTVPTLARFAAVMDSLTLPFGAVGYFNAEYEDETGEFSRTIPNYLLVVNLAPLPVGESVSISFVANKTVHTHAGELVSTATVISAAHDLREYAIASVTVAANPGLELQKSAQYFSEQSRVLYTLVATNTGNVDLTNVVFTDTVDSLLTVTDIVWSSFFTIFEPVTGNDVEVNTGWLPISFSRSISIWADIPEDIPPQTISNTAQVTANIAGTEVEIEATDTATFNMTGADAPSEANVALEKVLLFSASVLYYDTETWIMRTSPNSNVTAYRITVTNTGDIPLTDLVVTDEVDSRLIMQEVSIPAGATDHTVGNNVEVHIPLLGVGEAVVIDLTAHLPDGIIGTIPNTAYVTTAEGVSDSDTAILQTFLPQVELEKTVYPLQARPGDTVTYTLTIHNRGNIQLERLTLADVVSTELTNLTLTPDFWFMGGFTDNVLSVAINIPIQVGVSLPIVFTGVVSETAASGAVYNVASIRSAFHGIEDEDTARFEIIDRPIRITKTANASIIEANETITYILRVQNASNEVLTGLVVTDQVSLPLSVQSVIYPANATNNTAGNDVSVTLGALAPGEITEILVIAYVPASITEATVSSTAYVRLPGTNWEDSDTIAVRVVGQAAVPAVQLEKSSNGPSHTIMLYNPVTGEWRPGRNSMVASYALVVTNTGNVTLTDLVVTDTVDSRLSISHVPDFGFVLPAGATNHSVDNNIEVHIPSLAVGETAMIVFHVHVLCSLRGDIPNTAHVTTAQGVSDSDNDVLSLPDTPRIDFTKRVSPLHARPGETVTYTLTIQNHGNIPLEALTVTNALSAELTNAQIVDMSADITGGFDPNNNTLNLAFDHALPVDARVEIVFTAQVHENAQPKAVTITTLVGSLINSVERADSATFEVMEATDAPSIDLVKTVTRTTGIDMHIDPISGATYISPGSGAVNYSISITNTGNVPLTNLVVTTQIDERLSVRHIHVPGGTNQTVGNNVVLHIPLLPIGRTIQIPLITSAPDTFTTGTISHTVQVTTAEGVSDSDSSTFERNVRIANRDLEFVKTVYPLQVRPGDTVTYTITAYNRGNIPFAQLRIRDAISTQLTNLTIVSIPTGGYIDVVDNSLDLRMWNLPVGEYAQIIFTAVVPETTPPGIISNTATFRFDFGSPAPAAEATVDFTVLGETTQPTPSLEIQKNANVTEVQPGQAVRYTVRVTNTGDVALPDVLITDILPALLTTPQLLALPPGAVGGFAGNLLNVVLPPLAVGQVLEITYEATVHANAEPSVITSYAVARSSSFYLVEEDSVVVTIVPVADVSLDASAGQNGAHILRITNTGNIALTDLIVSNLLPSGITQPQLISLPTGAIGGFAGQLLAVNLAPLAPGETVEIIFSAIPTGNGAVVSTTNITSVAYDITDSEDTNFAVPENPGSSSVPGPAPGGGSFAGGNTPSRNTPPPAAAATTTAAADAATIAPPALVTGTHHAFMVGFPDGTVRPQGLMTRAEVATLFFRLFTDEYRAGVWNQTNNFADVGLHDWFNNAVSTVANAGIIQGMPNGNFEPDRLITRAEFATIAARFMNVTTQTANVFPDVEGHWAAQHINNLSRFGWVTGYQDGTFRPDQNITRAEVAALINRMLERRLQSPKDLLPGMLTWTDNLDVYAWYYLDIQEATNSNAFVMNEDGIHKTWTRLITPRQWASLEQPTSTPNSIVYSW